MYKYEDANFYNSKINGFIKPITLQQHKKMIRDLLPNIQATNSTTPFYKIFHGFDHKSMLKPLEPLAEKVRANYTDMLIVSMGGATLNPQIVLSIRDIPSGPKMRILNTTDPFVFHKNTYDLDLSKTCVLVISNSGNTIETVSMTSALIEMYRTAKVKNYKDNFIFLVGTGNTYLRQIGTELGSTLLDYDMGIGGRYSGFSSVGLLPGLIAGLDMKGLLEGASEVANEFMTEVEESTPAKAAITMYLARHYDLVCVSYANTLDAFLEWYTQIISESLGKDGKGITPIRGVCPMDQHSMFQLYLDGPKDKSYIFFGVDDESGYDYKLHKGVKPDYLEGKMLKQVHNAQFSATYESIKNNHMPIRSLVMDKLSAKNIGALMMHSAIEVILTGLLMEVNPFNNPGVDQIKVEVRKILAG